MPSRFNVFFFFLFLFCCPQLHNSTVQNVSFCVVITRWEIEIPSEYNLRLILITNTLFWMAHQQYVYNLYRIHLVFNIHNTNEFWGAGATPRYIRLFFAQLFHVIENSLTFYVLFILFLYIRATHTRHIHIWNTEYTLRHRTDTHAHTAYWKTTLRAQTVAQTHAYILHTNICRLFKKKQALTFFTLDRFETFWVVHFPLWCRWLPIFFFLICVHCSYFILKNRVQSCICLLSCVTPHYFIVRNIIRFCHLDWEIVCMFLKCIFMNWTTRE